MERSSPPPRREVLAALATGTGIALSGCNGSPGTDPRSETTTNTSTNGDEVQIDAPDTASWDEPFDVTVEGLPSAETVDVLVSGEDAEGSSFEGRATVETGDGTVSLTEATVVSESDDPLDGVVPGDVDVPLPLSLFQFASPLTLRAYSRPDEQALTYTVEREGETLGTASVTRRHPDVSSYVEPDDPELSGLLYEPTDGETGPGIVVLHGSGGNPSYRPAALLASRGYTVFALHYFSGENLPTDLSEIPIEYVSRAGEWLRERETTDGEQIGLYGASRGGELALLAGSEFDLFGPVVSISGSGLVWEGITEDWAEQTDTSAWSRDGDPVPYVDTENWYADPDSLSDETIEDASIPVENIEGRVLLVSGADDTLWSSVDFHEVAVDRLDEHGHPDYEHLVYEGAGHFFISPYMPVIGSIEYGGTYEGAAEASHDHWRAVLDTFSTLK